MHNLAINNLCPNINSLHPNIHTHTHKYVYICSLLALFFYTPLNIEFISKHVDSIFQRTVSWTLGIYFD